METILKIYSRIRAFFKQYLNQANDRENEQLTVDAIRSGIEFKGSNLWILICAIFVASLGLNTNSTAVIIGAMLISPLMGPIMGIGLGLGIYDFDLVKRSFKNLAVATLFSVLTSTLYFLISPLNEARSELLSRTSPTIYDVLIAFFGGMAGIIAMSSKQKGNVLPGVAIATALMPPLCTAGFGLANGNMHYFLGAFYLYFINSVFISFATTVGVKLMRFSHKQFVDTKRKEMVEKVVYTILIFTMAPSLFLTYNMIRSSYFQTAAYQFVSQEFNLSKTQVLNKSAEIEKGEKVIRVSLIGQELPPDSIIAIESRLNKFGLKGAKLFISQGYTGSAQAPIDLNSLNSMMFQDIYKDNQQKIEQQAGEISHLEGVIASYQRYDTIGAQIAPEIKVLFPQINQIAISDVFFTHVETAQIDSVTLAVVRFNHPFSRSSQQQFEAWLKARLSVKNLRLLIE